MKNYVATGLFCLVAVAGCGGGGASNVSDFCSSYNDAINSLVVKCLGAPQDAVTTQFSAQDAQTCKNMAQAVAAKRATYDSAKGQSCLDELNGIACADLATFGGPNDPCMTAVSGTVASGGSCYGDNDCTSGNFCDGVSGANCPASCNAYAQQGDDCTQGQTCAPNLSCDGSKCAAPAAKGQPCGGNNMFCGGGLYCDGVNGAAGICQPDKAKGETCTGGGQCQLGLTCISGSCAAIKGVGETCSADSDCGLYTYCKSGNCTEYPGTGASCGINANQSFVDCLGSWCKITNQTSYTGTCTDYLKLGDTCSPNDFGSCGDAECDNGKCTAACAEK